MKTVQKMAGHWFVKEANGEAQFLQKDRTFHKLWDTMSGVTKPRLNPKPQLSPSRVPSS